MTESPSTAASGTYQIAPPPVAPKRGSWVKPVVFLLIVVAVAFVVWRVVQNRKADAAMAASKQAAAMSRPVPVQVIAVQQKTVPIYLTALGTVTPYNSVTVMARVTGQLMSVNFKEGDEVRAGQTLMTIDPRPYQAALDQAKGSLAHDMALLKNAQAEAARYTALYKEGVVSKEQYDLQMSNLGQYEGAIKTDQAAIEADELNLKYCAVTSPISGRIGLRLVDAGNVITANTTQLIKINQFQPIAVFFTLPEDQLPQVLDKLRGLHQLVAEAYDRSDTDKITDGKLLTADNQIDTTTGTARLKSVFDNKDELLFPNQFVNIHLILEQRPNAIVIPAAGLQHGTQGDYVWAVQSDSTVKMLPVRANTTQGTTTILEAGVDPGQLVVIDGADKLRNGVKVEARQIGQGGPKRQAGDGGANTPSESGPKNSSPNGAAPGNASPNKTGPAKDPNSGDSKHHGHPGNAGL